MRLTLPPWSKVINNTFIPLIENRDRYLICYGGRGSSKSVFAAKKLIYRCLKEKYFRYILYRKTYNTIKDSQFQTIKDIVYDWGLQELFTFNVSPLEIRCINGNKFICRGGDEPTKLKSIKDPTGVWYEEEIPDEGDFITITTSIRTQKADYLQEILTINPEVEGDYTDHWFWKRFFKDQPEGTFSGTANIDIGNGKTFTTTYTCHNSTYLDNRWLPDSFIAQLLELKRTNPYYYTIYALGKWGNKTTDGNFYKNFKRLRNARPIEQCAYNPNLPLCLTFDFNVNPYVTICIHQVTSKRAIQIDEICLPSPNNRTDLACRKFVERYSTHTAGVWVYGDPAGLHEDTRTEKGYNDFYIIMEELRRFNPVAKWLKVAPPVHTRGMFINAVFEDNAQGLEFIISEKCTNTIADYMFLKEASDGTKAKIKVKNPDTGVTYEKYGHCFVGETLIATIDGEKRIDEIKVGDFVLTRKGYKKVLATHDNGIKYFRQYKINDKFIRCTPDHAFWANGQFYPIGGIDTNSTFCLLDKLSGQFSDVECVKMPTALCGTNQVYDITVEDEHEYFANGILVHNCSDANDYFYCNIFANEFSNYQRGNIVFKPLMTTPRTQRV